jgi:hypothetical protein
MIFNWPYPEEYDLQLAISQKNMTFNWPYPEEYDLQLVIYRRI